MSDEMEEIKKQVVESSSKKPFRSFKKTQTSNSQPPNVMSNIEYEQDDYEDEIVLYVEESQDEELVEVHGLWDFILPTFDNEDDHEALHVSTRSKGFIDSSQPI